MYGLTDTDPLELDAEVTLRRVIDEFASRHSISRLRSTVVLLESAAREVRLQTYRQAMEIEKKPAAYQCSKCERRYPDGEWASPGVECGAVIDGEVCMGIVEPMAKA